jgi:hypothetical protein
MSHVIQHICFCSLKLSVAGTAAITRVEVAIFFSARFCFVFESNVRHETSERSTTVATCRAQA